MQPWDGQIAGSYKSKQIGTVLRKQQPRDSDIRAAPIWKKRRPRTRPWAKRKALAGAIEDGTEPLSRALPQEN